MIIDGKNYGVKPFVVQLRDPETYALLPGINIGDCGAKMVNSPYLYQKVINGAHLGKKWYRQWMD